MRAPLLWGGEDFKWYIHKIDPQSKYDFKPFVKIPVVVWIRKDKPEILERFNMAFEKLKDANVLDEKNLIEPSLMQEKYSDAPLEK